MVCLEYFACDQQSLYNYVCFVNKYMSFGMSQ